MLWTDQAVRDLSRLDPTIGRRVMRKLGQAAEDPVRLFSRLVGFDDHKLRIGDYRLLATLVHDTKVIIVERVDHRSRIYDRARRAAAKGERQGG